MCYSVSAVLAPSQSTDWRRAMALCAAADAADAVVSASRLRRGEPRALVVTVAALAGGATGLWLVWSAP